MAKKTLGVDKLDVLSDKGFYVASDIRDCENDGITVFMPVPSFNPTKNTGVPEPEFCFDKFVYDSKRDVYVCPGGAELGLLRHSYRGKEECWGGLYGTKLCVSCAFKGRCTMNRRGRRIFRPEYQDTVDRLRVRVSSSEGKEKLSLRREIVEHPFGTMKRAFNQGYVLLKGLRKVKGEVGFTMLAYNMRRAINILGVGTLISLMKA